MPLNKLTHLLKISEREWPRVFSMGVLYFLLMVSGSLSRTASTAFFLKDAGAGQLPLMYLVNSVLLVAISFLYFRIVDRVDRARLLIYLMAGSSALVFLLRVMIWLNLGFVSYIMFALSKITGLIVAVHFWTFANDTFDPREGKRIFPMIGSVGLAAMVLGGLATKPIVSVFGTVSLFTLWALLWIICVPVILWTNRLAKASGMKVNAGSAQALGTGKSQRNFFQGIGEVWKIDLIRTLSYLSIPMWLAVYFIDYQFFIAMNEVYPDQDQLSSFLGIFSSVSSVIGLVLQTFVAGRLLQKYGIGASILVHPLTLAIGSVGLVLRGFFGGVQSLSLASWNVMTAIFPKLSDSALFSSIGQAASQLVFNAVSEDKRGRSRAFIAGIVQNASIALAGLILIAFKLAHIPLSVVAVLTVGFSLLWTVLSLKIRSDYFRSLVHNLSSHNIDLRISAFKAIGRLQESNINLILLKTLNSQNEEIALFALEILRGNREIDMANDLCRVLPDAAPRVKAAIFEILGEFGKAESLPNIRPFLSDSNVEIRKSAVRAFGKCGASKDMVELEKLMEDPDISVAAETVIALISKSPSLKTRIFAVEEIRIFANSASASHRAKAAYIIGEVGFRQLLAALLNIAFSENEVVQEEAFKSIGKLGDAKVVPKLVKFLDVERLIQNAEDTIVSMGDAILSYLH